jgi:hypothetical protein
MGTDWKIGDVVILGGELFLITGMLPSGGAKIARPGSEVVTYISRSALDQTIRDAHEESVVLTP